MHICLVSTQAFSTLTVGWVGDKKSISLYKSHTSNLQISILGLLHSFSGFGLTWNGLQKNRAVEQILKEVVILVVVVGMVVVLVVVWWW